MRIFLSEPESGRNFFGHFKKAKKRTTVKRMFECSRDQASAALYIDCFSLLVLFSRKDPEVNSCDVRVTEGPSPHPPPIKNGVFFVEKLDQETGFS